MPNVAALTALIRKTETAKADPIAYETVIGHRQDALAKPITQMTIDEVLAAQLYLTRKLGMPSGAAGGYQIIRKTLLALKANLGLKGTEKFTPAMQDKLGLALLKGRGLDKYLAGQISATAFGNQLAREWASFPVLTDQRGNSRDVKIGQSYYAGDGVNKALVRPAVVAATLREVLADTAPPKPVPAPEPDVQYVESFKPDWGKIAVAALVLASLVYIAIQFI